MNVLIIDRDPLVCQLMTSKLEQVGHSVSVEENKNLALIQIKESVFDCIFIDPSPLKNVRSFVFDLLKSLGKVTARPYIVLLSKDANEKDAIEGFCNNLLRKPLDSSALSEIMDNAKRLQLYCQILEKENDGDIIDDSVGIIDQKAFLQLFLSSIDRGFRYAEQNFVLFIEITNLKEMFDSEDKENVHKALNQLADKISWVRRQSDVVGRVAIDNFGVLLQRPMYETEIDDAFSRFHEKLRDIVYEIPLETKFKISLSVIELPFAKLPFQTNIGGISSLEKDTEVEVNE